MLLKPVKKERKRKADHNRPTPLRKQPTLSQENSKKASSTTPTATPLPFSQQSTAVSYSSKSTTLQQPAADMIFRLNFTGFPRYIQQFITKHRRELQLPLGGKSLNNYTKLGETIRRHLSNIEGKKAKEIFAALIRHRHPCQMAAIKTILPTAKEVQDKSKTYDNIVKVIKAQVISQSISFIEFEREISRLCRLTTNKEHKEKLIRCIQLMRGRMTEINRNHTHWSSPRITFSPPRNTPINNPMQRCCVSFPRDPKNPQKLPETLTVTVTWGPGYPDPYPNNYTIGPWQKISQTTPRTPTGKH